jgi:oligoendopeptidase F
VKAIPLGLVLILAAVGCRTVQTAAQSAADYQQALSAITTDYQQAVQEFNQKIQALPSTKEADKLKQEAVAALQADLAQTRQELEALKPPVEQALNHPLVLGTVKTVEGLVGATARMAAGMSGDSLKTLSVELEKLATRLQKAAEPPQKP